jgi:hypothetical protein
MEGLGISKEDVIKACWRFLDERRKQIKQEILFIEESINTETKSSVGDKFETARARLQTDKSRLLKQQSEIQQQENDLLKTVTLVPGDGAGPGRLIHTNAGVFYVAVPLGKLKVGAYSVQVLSQLSPFVSKMKGLKTGDYFEVNGRRYCIEKME